MLYYTGIGSRETPLELAPTILSIARTLAQGGYTLRSGAASGADTFFEDGCDAGTGAKEIYLPWDGFANRKADGRVVFADISEEAFDLAAQIHPAWHRCGPGAMRLHARNCYQVLGRDLRTPSEFLICWTKGGRGQGGTGQALRLAMIHRIPCFDLGSPSVLNDLDRYLSSKSPTIP